MFDKVLEINPENNYVKKVLIKQLEDKRRQKSENHIKGMPV
jgi:hypothetical protein